MEPKNFSWVPSGPGVATKLMGVFNERGTKIAFHRLDGGARLRLEADSLWFVWSGSGDAGGKTWRRWTTMQTEGGEHPEIEATEFRRSCRWLCRAWRTLPPSAPPPSGGDFDARQAPTHPKMVPAERTNNGRGSSSQLLSDLRFKGKPITWEVTSDGYDASGEPG